jgi:hypothetical protein
MIFYTTFSPDSTKEYGAKIPHGAEELVPVLLDPDLLVDDWMVGSFPSTT